MEKPRTVFLIAGVIVIALLISFFLQAYLVRQHHLPIEPLPLTTPETFTSGLDQIRDLLEKGKFEEVKRLMDSQRNSDPYIHWATRLKEADEMYQKGNIEQWKKEYQEFFKFYEEWEKRGKQSDNPQLN